MEEHMTFLGPIVGIILIVVAAGSVGTVFYMVLKEKQVHEEYFIPPPKPAEDPPVPATPATEE